MRFGLRILLLSLLAFVAACTKTSDAQRASGSVPVLLPQVSADGVKGFGVVVLEGIDDLSEVRGEHAQFYFAPKLRNHQLEGFAPQAQFMRNKDGVYVPADETSQSMAAVYYEFQKLHEFDKKVGVGDWVSWPRKVAISFRMKSRFGRGLEYNNAFHDGESDATLIAPYNAGALPLALNPGVLAHEHFHALFNAAVMRPLLEEKVVVRDTPGKMQLHGDVLARLTHIVGLDIEEKSNDGSPLVETPQPNLIYNSVLIRAMNEGLADAWGWLNTGDYGFVGRSIVSQKINRNLKRGPFTYNSMNLQRDIFDAPRGDFTPLFYKYGAEIARGVVSQAWGKYRVEPTTEQRLDVARAIIASLPRLAQDFRNAQNSTMEPIHVHEIVGAEMQKFASPAPVAEVPPAAPPPASDKAEAAP